MQISKSFFIAAIVPQKLINGKSWRFFYEVPREGFGSKTLSSFCICQFFASVLPAKAVSPTANPFVAFFSSWGPGNSQT